MKPGKPNTPKYKPSDEVDFVIIGSGAAGGILAKELSANGFRVVVLEQGPYLTEADFTHDEIKVLQEDLLTNHPDLQPNTYRETPDQTAKHQRAVYYGRIVGGTSVHFTANFWRFHEIDFIERSKIGPVPGANLADWPITYADLEPYYTKVEWDIGVSGLADSSPFDPPRSKPYPMPPLPVKGCGVVFERGARNLGWHPFPAPLAILSQPRPGRSACVNCGFCLGFGCEVGAKSTSLSAAIPAAEKTGRCEIRPNSYVHKIELDANGRATGALYFDEKKVTHLQRAKAVIVCANGAETPRLLLLSASKQHPNGLANFSGYVGKHLMLNGNGVTTAVFEHPLNDYKGFAPSRVLHDFYELDAQKVGFYGGGALDARFDITPIAFAQGALPPGTPRWGKDYKAALAHYYTRTMEVFSHGTSLPVENNSMSLDPELKDAWGLPALRMTYKDHPDDIKLIDWLNLRASELLDASGALKHWTFPAAVQNVAFHLLGTCRMGNDPKTSVINPDHRAHDVKNLFICDGSSLVTSGRGQPTMTIMALAFRAADRITALAKRGELFRVDLHAVTWLAGPASYTNLGETMRVNRSAVVCSVGLLCCGIGIFSRDGHAQSPAATAPKLAEEQFKNIQVLKGIPADQLIPAMQFISASLGVECEYCHVHNANEKDDKKPKVAARKMITMMMAINKDNFEGRREVTCYSCHRGSANPIATPVIAAEEAVARAEEHGAAPADKEPLPSADQLLEKYLAAVGGADALHKITSRVQKGSLIVAGNPTPVEVFAIAPDKRLSVVHMKNGDSVTAFNGQQGWLTIPARTHVMSAAENDAARIDADLYFAANVKSLYQKFSVTSGEKIDAHDTWLVVGRSEGKPPLRLYLDKDSGLLLRLVRYAETPLGRNPTQIDYADYRSADGVRIPFRWTLARPGGNRFTIQIDQTQQNVPVDATKFTPPPPASPKARP